MEHIKETLLDAREELKRLEHIIYVSLKYTRTVDVILNALKMLVNVYDLIIEAMLEKAKKEGKTEVLAKSPALRATKLSEVYADDPKMLQFLSFYWFLKSILKLPQAKICEYRRHVALIVDLNNTTAEINIDNLTNCERFAHKFFNYSWMLVSGKKEEDE
ncbi:MAG TPA: hypothetical protein VJA23_06085 [Candidatus Nanoarchaeia archaeon]|nr:hypothetical protein [Candidatus Nanoarchaeia archaeon]